MRAEMEKPTFAVGDRVMLKQDWPCPWDTVILRAGTKGVIERDNEGGSFPYKIKISGQAWFFTLKGMENYFAKAVQQPPDAAGGSDAKGV